MRILMLGAPGSGKGTHGERAAQRYGVPHISTGELLREQISEGSDVGLAARPYMMRGELVPDDMIVSIVLGRIAAPDGPDGYIADGFPRNLAQAIAAYDTARQVGKTLDMVLFLDVPHGEIVRRLIDRGKKSGRADDTEATIRHRIEVYQTTTRPLLDYYDKRGILATVSSVGATDVVTERVFGVLDSVRAARPTIPPNGR